MQADAYSANAEDCRRQAEREEDPEIKEKWLRLASEWDRLATAPHK
jgi:hypothetical protein